MTSKRGMKDHQLKGFDPISEEPWHPDESEEKYRCLFENSPLGIVICELIEDEQGQPIDFIHLKGNPATSIQTGCPLENIIGKRASELVTPEETAALSRRYGEVVYRGEPLNYTQYFPVYDRYLEVRAFHLADKRFCLNFHDITQQKKAEAELQLKKAVFDLSLTANSIAGIDGKVSHANRAFLQMWGYDRVDQVIGKALKSFFHREEEMISVLESLTAEGAWQGTFTARRKDGSTFISRGIATTVLDQEGHVIGYQSSNLDVTEEVRAEEEIALLAKFPAEDPHPVLRVSSCGEVLYSNEPGYTLLKLWGGGTLPSDQMSFVKQALENKRLYECEVAIGNTVFTLTFSPVTESDIVHIYGRDITEKVKMREALQKEHARAQQYLDIVGVILVILDRDQRVILINRKGCETLGVTEEEALGQNWFDCFIPESMRSTMKAAFAQLMAGDLEPLEYYENSIQTKSGEERLIAWHNCLLHDDHGEILYSLSSGEDITERRATEVAAYRAQDKLLKQQMHEKERIQAELDMVKDELVRKTQLAAIGQVSGSIAHDLRNPLGSVRNANYLLQRRLTLDDPRIREPLAIIEEEVVRADQIISNLLSIARQRTPRKERLDFGDLVQSVCKEMCHARNVTYRLELSESPFWIKVDATQMEQVVTNLCSNACDAMGDKGVLRVCAFREGNEDVLQFIDSGPGIAPEVQETLFEPLVTTKAKGTGLGLTICQQILQAHHGRIGACSEDGGGTCIYIHLPSAQSETPGS